LILLPRDPRLATRALSLYPAQTLKARVGKSCLRLALQVALPIPLETTTVRISPATPFLQCLAKVAGQLPNSIPKFAMLAGNPYAEGRRFTLLVFDAGARPVAVVKAGCNEAAAELIEREAHILGAIAADTPGVPKLRGSFHDGRIHALVLSYIDGDAPAGDTTDKIAALLTSWVHTGETVAVGETALWRSLQGRASSHPIVARLADKSVHQALFHGDFAPWNIKVSPADGSWTVLDWERGELCGLPGWDWFHYVVQSGVLAEKRSPLQLCDRLEFLLRSKAFAEYAAKANTSDIARELLLAYLLYRVEVLCPTTGQQQSRDLLHLLISRWPND